MIYNPYFERYGIDAVVVPMGCKAEDYAAFLKLVFRLTNIRGALVTMPHKVTTVPLLDEVTTTVKVAGACNAIRAAARTARWSATCSTARASCAACSARAGRSQGARAWWSAAAASARRSRRRWPRPASRSSGCSTPTCGRGRLGGAAARPTTRTLKVEVGSKDPAGYDIVVNATPLGMKDGDPLPMDVDADRARDLRRRGRDEAGDHAVPARRHGRAAAAIQVGTDMLFEQIPAYLEFFGFRTTTPDELRAVAQINY